MAEESIDQAAEAAEANAPNGTEPSEPEKDWKAEYERLLKHSRSWEDKAKRLKEKADRLDELEAASKTDAEKLSDAQKRAEAAEAELAKYKADAERAELVGEIAAKKQVDTEWLSRMAGSTREEIEANADFIARKLKGAPIYPVVKDGGAKGSAGVTKEQIEAIKDPRERVRMRAKHIDLYK